MPNDKTSRNKENNRAGASSRGEKNLNKGTPVRHEGYPVSGRISSSYGTRKDPKTGAVATPHKGIDIAVKINTPVRATGSGVVTRAGWQNPKNHDQGYGQRVTVNHGNGNTSTYGHCSSITVKVGDKVKSGDVICNSGNSGKSTGPHVHYEERYKGNPHAPTFHPVQYKPRPSPKK
jgi:murein DD-endopeptidase MepM/ murein hydrolase activator NlpD